MKRQDFRHLEKLRVRWAEVDLQKIVFNGHYLSYFDIAMAGYWRALALPYHETMAHFQGDLFVRKATLEYLGSARYDEQLAVGMRCARIGKSSIRFEAAVFREQRCLVHGELIYVFADPSTQTSRELPQALRDLLTGFEAGEPMLEVRVGAWSEQGPLAQGLREAAFKEALDIDSGMGFDDADTRAVHAVAFNRLGVALATGRLLPTGVPAQDGCRVGRIGRMATGNALRGAGLGTAVLQSLRDVARKRGDQELRLMAHSGVDGFYRRAGFQPCGEVFEEAGIPHQEMRQVL